MTKEQLRKAHRRSLNRRDLYRDESDATEKAYENKKHDLHLKIRRAMDKVQTLESTARFEFCETFDMYTDVWGSAGPDCYERLAA